MALLSLSSKNHFQWANREYAFKEIPCLRPLRNVHALNKHVPFWGIRGGTDVGSPLLCACWELSSLEAETEWNSACACVRVKQWRCIQCFQGTRLKKALLCLAVTTVWLQVRKRRDESEWNKCFLPPKQNMEGEPPVKFPSSYSKGKCPIQPVSSRLEEGREADKSVMILLVASPCFDWL